ncbi:MAG: hypothetical protein HGA45_10335 [Chloroflexales bacterium]|nr:hypothetical protein [Chloroflexales bacterium]
MLFSQPYAVNFAPPPTPGFVPALADKVGYIATTWEMLAHGGWDTRAARQLTTFVEQLAAELGAADCSVLDRDLHMLRDLLDMRRDSSPSPEHTACVTCIITAIWGWVAPGTAPRLDAGAAFDLSCADCRYATLDTPLRERSVGG